MSDFEAELEGLEADLDAFIQDRVAPSLGALEARIAKRIEQAVAPIAAELARQNQSRDQHLEREIEVLSRQLENQGRYNQQLEQGLRKLDGRLAALAGRFGRDEVQPGHLDVPPAAMPADRHSGEWVSDHLGDLDQQGIVGIARYVREHRIRVALVGAAAAGAVLLAASIGLNRANTPSGTRPIADRAEPVGGYPEAAQPAGVDDTQAADPAASGRSDADIGLQSIADKSVAIAKLCAASGACSFGGVWSRADRASRQLLLAEAIRAADIKACDKTRPAKVDAQNLDGPYRLVVSCIASGPPAQLTGPSDYHAAAKRLLDYLGAHP